MNVYIKMATRKSSHHFDVPTRMYHICIYVSLILSTYTNMSATEEQASLPRPLLFTSPHTQLSSALLYTPLRNRPERLSLFAHTSFLAMQPFLIPFLPSHVLLIFSSLCNLHPQRINLVYERQNSHFLDLWRNLTVAAQRIDCSVQNAIRL